MSNSLPDPEVTGIEVAKLYRESRERVLDQLASANLKIDELRELIRACDALQSEKDATIGSLRLKLGVANEWVEEKRRDLLLYKEYTDLHDINGLSPVEELRTQLGLARASNQLACESLGSALVAYRDLKDIAVELTEAVKELHSNPWRSYKALVERAEKEVTKE